MKKSIIWLIGIVIIVGIAIAAIERSNHPCLLDTNVEALSVIEEGAHGTGRCWNSIEATENELILVCVSCIYIQADKLPWSDSGQCY